MRGAPAEPRPAAQPSDLKRLRGACYDPREDRWAQAKGPARRLWNQSMCERGGCGAACCLITSQESCHLSPVLTSSRRKAEFGCRPVMMAALSLKPHRGEFSMEFSGRLPYEAGRAQGR